MGAVDPEHLDQYVPSAPASPLCARGVIWSQCGPKDVSGKSVPSGCGCVEPGHCAYVERGLSVSRRSVPANTLPADAASTGVVGARCCDASSDGRQHEAAPPAYVLAISARIQWTYPTEGDEPDDDAARSIRAAAAPIGVTPVVIRR